MKALKIAIIAILLLNAGLAVFNWMTEEPPTPVQSVQAEIAAADGLDLPALTALVKEIRSGQELERRLNERDSINNLDLNGDKKVDYISVSEFGDVQKKIGFSLLVEPEKDQQQEVAVVTVERNQDKAEIQVVGNEQIYGDGAIYNDWAPVEREKEIRHSGTGYGFSLLAGYFLFRPLWISPWHFGYYPSYFSPYPMASRSMYAGRVDTVRSSTTQKGANRFQKSSKTSVRNPNKGKVASRGVTRSLKKPTSTQRKFQTAQKNTLRSGGFGRTGGSSSGSKSLVGSQPTQRKFQTAQKSTLRSGGFGRAGSSSFGSKSLFGSQRNTGSFRSSSSRSRSFRVGGK